jgi:hypothetical protein
LIGGSVLPTGGLGAIAATFLAAGAVGPRSRPGRHGHRWYAREEALQKLDTLAEQIAQQSWRSPETPLELFDRAEADVTPEDLDQRGC